MTTPEISWPRPAGPLTLRQPTAADIDQVLAWRNRPEVTRWLLRTQVEPETFRDTWLSDQGDPRDHSAVAVLEGQVVGTGSLWVTDAMGQSHAGQHEWTAAEAGMGYLIDPAHAGRGYATHLARALLDLAFGEVGVRRVTAGCFADNVASWRIMDKLGMRREQHGIQDSWHAELGWIDGFTYAMLADEWTTRRAHR